MNRVQRAVALHRTALAAGLRSEVSRWPLQGLSEVMVIGKRETYGHHTLHVYFRAKGDTIHAFGPESRLPLPTVRTMTEALAWIEAQKEKTP